MIAKIHTHKDGKILIAVADTAIVGKRFEEGVLQLDLTGDFYKGTEKSAEEIGDLMRNADFVNLVGEEAIKLGLAEEVIDEAAVRRVQGIPFAQGILVKDD
jgi:hypothetical protein